MFFLCVQDLAWKLISLPWKSSVLLFLEVLFKRNCSGSTARSFQTLRESPLFSTGDKSADSQPFPLRNLALILSTARAPWVPNWDKFFSRLVLSYFFSATVFFPLCLIDSWFHFSARMPRGRKADPGGNTAAIYTSNVRGRTAEKSNLRPGLREHGKSGVRLIKSHIGKKEYLSFYIVRQLSLIHDTRLGSRENTARGEGRCHHLEGEESERPYWWTPLVTDFFLGLWKRWPLSASSTGTSAQCTP